MITNNTSLQDLFDYAITTLSDVQSGEEFIVKELFRGFEWNRIDKGFRTKLGAMFFNYANTQGTAILVPLGKTPQNQQRYRKL